MTEPEDLRARIEAARKAGEPAPQSRQTARQASSVADALTHSIGLVVAVALGGLIGYTIDKLAGSGPWALLIFLVFGMAAGFLNIIRAAQKMTRAALEDEAASRASQEQNSGGADG